ncbi:MAG: DEAD/DEAH box helicase [Hahellaceae bacterium]|jgi:ATP-dependent RNA helicase RhlE|nr:DEAD/DEAH box helicase [Hahellaceae bacterium]MCP5209841.1 DEAD/DEAH box helicase [Hahellaceae bacterium]
MSFASLGLSAPILEAVAKEGYDTPSPIQSQAIPAILAGKDVMAAAQTGTGKTAGFTLPMLEILSRGDKVQPNQVRALILAPTRELAAQVGESVATYGRHLPLRSTVVFGGVKINPQMIALRKGVDVLVATPGRLLDLYRQNAVRFKQLEILVLDEADRMLDMGFINDIKKILAALPKDRQNLMFSATFSDDIRNLAKGLVHDPVEISVSPRNTTVKMVEQWICPVDKKQKPALLKRLILDNQWDQVLVFSKTKHGANRLSRFLDESGIKSSAIHGSKGQGARTRALADFKSGAIRALVATDIAARGLDIDQLPHVVNFDLPNVPEDYVHRIGRTGRAGASGQAVSLVSADEFKQLSDIERLTGEMLERRMVDGFEPTHSLPESRKVHRPLGPKRPKKPKDGHRDGQRSAGNARGNNPPERARRGTEGRQAPRRRNPG